MTWTHTICRSCWNERYEGEPVTVRDADVETCCFCGGWTRSGIYVRHDPKTLSCNHEDQV